MYGLKLEVSRGLKTPQATQSATSARPLGAKCNNAKAPHHSCTCSNGLRTNPPYSDDAPTSPPTGACETLKPPPASVPRGSGTPGHCSLPTAAPVHMHRRSDGWPGAPLRTRGRSHGPAVPAAQPGPGRPQPAAPPAGHRGQGTHQPAPQSVPLHEREEPSTEGPQDRQKAPWAAE